MILTDKDIREYQKMWWEEFGEEISEVEARKSASELLELYRMLYFEHLPSIGEEE